MDALERSPCAPSTERREPHWFAVSDKGTRPGPSDGLSGPRP